MLSRLLNYLTGFLVIKVTGNNLERFVNLAMNKGIKFLDIQKSEKVFIMKTKVSDFYLLKNCIKKTQVIVKIISRKGIVFKLYKYKKRKLFWTGIFIFMIILYILSSFVWSIQIDGNKNISIQDISQELNKNGVKIGSLKKNVDCENIKQKLLDKFDSILWAFVQIKGTNVKIEIVENTNNSKLVDKDTPCDIIAKKNCIIYSIMTIAGEPVIKEKDVVQAGDVLVKGELLVTENDNTINKRYVHARANIMGKTYYHLYNEKPYIYINKIYTGKKKKSYILQYKDRKIKILNSKTGFKNFTTNTSLVKLPVNNQYMSNMKLITEVYEEYNPQVIKLNIDEVKNELKIQINNKLYQTVGNDIKIIDEKLNFKTENSKIKADALITVCEPIDEEKTLIITN